MRFDNLMLRSAEQQSLEDVSIEAFLQSIEKKAYRMALLALSNHADAIDVLQDSMLKLVSNYEDRPSHEWKPLFYKILQNRIRDFQRQYKMKNLLFFWKSDDHDNLIEEWSDDDENHPELDVGKERMQAHVLKALQALPEKQQQCFLMRSWEGMSVIETAKAMGCSEGSVKTHYFRAVNKLRELLGEEYDVQI
ncbi:RNA polymerase sigma factor [Paraneptunicella aestuarii]|uniref:RNA polymerase sigma factor n=1 Tax=Paraneptunicella aestuarii TaxID=2831148 RepID=UPI001E3E530F|nr:RNA polymerase sigma factor [Paraneptunicella aestuarii]UAA37630.1 RNA polymerase sigma factor [Paraneptunicella aestuarii]